ncbi:MAG: type II secretion system F family protein [Candidatus Obscuribacterales bacterium]|nr:type II secretion system F family protein [Candidatus Obscuribacterales bacterium]
MSNTLISILTFAGMAIFGLLIFRPVFAQYVDAYQVRIRARKESNLTSAEQPRDSMILLSLSGLGQIALTSFPAVADQRTIVLLAEANYRTPQHLAIFTGIRAALAGTVLLIGLLAAASNPVNLLLTLPAAVLVWLVPNFFLSSRAAKRKQQILRELPIIIDLLIVCAQAGLGLLQGIDKIEKEVADSCPVLTTELKQLINDVKMFAKSAPMALREMGERCGSDELINLASALIAAESKGADMSYPLKQQADAMRDRLKRKKEEEAGKVPVKMVPVIMIFIMPLILAPMLGPAVVVIVSAIDPILKTLK